MEADCCLLERRGRGDRQGPPPAVSSFFPSSAAAAKGSSTTCGERDALLLNSSSSSSSSRSKLGYVACAHEAPSVPSLLGPRLVAMVFSSLSLTILRLRGSSSVLTLPFQWLEQQQQQQQQDDSAAAADGDCSSSSKGDGGAAAAGQGLPQLNRPHDQLSLPLCWNGDCLAAAAAAAASRWSSSSKGCSSTCITREEKGLLAPPSPLRQLSPLNPDPPTAAATATPATAAAAAAGDSCMVVGGASVAELLDAEGRYLPVHCERIVVVSAPPRICAIYLWCLLLVVGLHALGWYFCKQQRHLEGTLCHLGLHFVASAANLLFFSSAAAAV
ncbi:hypothetical protein Esti_001623 [Eimeria stiedai]